MILAIAFSSQSILLIVVGMARHPLVGVDLLDVLRGSLHWRMLRVICRFSTLDHQLVRVTYRSYHSAQPCCLDLIVIGSERDKTSSSSTERNAWRGLAGITSLGLAILHLISAAPSSIAAHGFRSQAASRMNSRGIARLSSVACVRIIGYDFAGKRR